jgi:glutaminase
MINAGAIASTSLIAGNSPDDRLARILAVFSNFAGRSLDIYETVYESEKRTGHRNRAIGHMLRNFDILTEDPEPALDLYFRQCSINVDCRDLAVMAATLANGGRNPITGERAIRDDLVDSVLSVMTTCGMYDSAGEWLYSVGMPAKSGVGGGILAVLPGQLGIGVFSPPLDEHGNSVRGVRVCQEMSRDLNLHFLRLPRTSRSAVRAEYDLQKFSSKRRRLPAEREVLDRVGNRACVYELQGDLVFSTIEVAVRKIVEASNHVDYAIVDLRRVTQIDPAAARLLLELVLAYRDAGRYLGFASGDAQPRFLRYLDEQLSLLAKPIRPLSFSDVDRAIEWCETRLLAEHGQVVPLPEPVALADQPVCAGLDAGEIAELARHVEPVTFERGSLVLQRGDAADRMYFLTTGEVSVTIDLPSGQLKRLATFSPGMVFGELAIVDRGPRTADVRADTRVECLALTSDALESIGVAHPRIQATILGNLLRNASRMVTRLNSEIGTLVA